MSYQQFQQGAGASDYNYNNYTAPQASSSSQFNNTNSTPAATTTTPAPTLPGRQLTNTFPCTWPGCPRFFACPHNVQQHIREKHTHEKPYKCDQCFDAAFARQYGLNRHKAQVHGVGEKPSRVPAGQRTYGTAPSAKQQQQQPFVPFTQPTQATMGGGFGFVEPQQQQQQQQPHVPSTGQTLPAMGDQEFAELMGFPQAENSREEVSGGDMEDVEMSDDQFNNQFDFGANQQEPTAAAVEMTDAQRVQSCFDTAQAINALRNSEQNGGGILLGCGECDFFAATDNDVRSHMHDEHQVPSTPLCACELCSMVFASSEADAENQKALLADQGGFQKVREADASFPGVQGAGFATTASTANTSAWQPEVNNYAGYATAGTIDPTLLSIFSQHKQ
jgi:hypothetical protein